jgi:protein TonB
MMAVACLFLSAAPQDTDEPVLRTPSMPEGSLVHKVEPNYPRAALLHRTEGTVRFTAIIGKDGRVEHLRLLDGHPLLVRAAREAARQWIYRTSLLGREPVRVITILAVPFRIGSSVIP